MVDKMTIGELIKHIETHGSTMIYGTSVLRFITENRAALEAGMKPVMRFKRDIDGIWYALLPDGSYSPLRGSRRSGFDTKKDCTSFAINILGMTVEVDDD